MNIVIYKSKKSEPIKSSSLLNKMGQDFLEKSNEFLMIN